jgi:PAS domain S-box-containing protein
MFQKWKDRAAHSDAESAISGSSPHDRSPSTDLSLTAPTYPSAPTGAGRVAVGTWVGLAALIALAGAVGWVVGSPTMLTYGRGLPWMVPNTIACLLLVAAALVDETRGGSPRRGRLLLAPVTLVAGFHLLGRLTGQFFNLDARLFGAYAMRIGPPDRPVRMADVTADSTLAPLIAHQLRRSGRRAPWPAFLSGALTATVVALSVGAGIGYATSLLRRSSGGWRSGAARRWPSRHVRAREREERRQALDLRQRRFVGLLDNAPAVVFIEDRDGRYVHVNRSHEEVFGCRRETFLGCSDLDLFPPDVAARLRERDAGVLRNSVRVEFQEVVPDAAGRRRVWRTQTFPIDVPGGETLLCGIADDITDARAAQEALRISEQRLALALEGTEDGLWDWHLPTGEVHFSPRWCRRRDGDLLHAPAEIRSMMTPLRVLLVEDNAADVFLASLHLRDLPQPVALTTAGTTAQARAIRAASAGEPARRPHLVLLDLNLPVESGDTELAMVRETPAHAALPATLVATHAPCL